MEAVMKVRRFLEEAIAELRKVNWTPRQDLINTTLVVICTSALLGAFITLSDLLLSHGVNGIIK